MENVKEESCAICGNKPAWFTSIMVFLPTCKDHHDLADKFQVAVVKKKLGLIKEYDADFKKCEICNCELTEPEAESIEDTDMIRTCTKHRVARKWFQIDLSKLWFDFEKEQGTELEYNQDNRVKFAEWRQKKQR